MEKEGPNLSPVQPSPSAQPAGTAAQHSNRLGPLPPAHTRPSLTQRAAHPPAQQSRFSRAGCARSLPARLSSSLSLAAWSRASDASPTARSQHRVTISLSARAHPPAPLPPPSFFHLAPESLCSALLAARGPAPPVHAP